jgi:hypothetical protein
MSLFPTEQWLDAYRQELNGNTALNDVAAGWDKGNILFAITDLPLEETYIGDLPREAFTDVPDSICRDIADLTLAEAPEMIDESVRADLPDRSQDLLRQLAEIRDETIYVSVGFDNSDSTEVRLVGSPAEHEYGSIIRGSCETWQQIVEGRPATSAVLSGDLDASGAGLFQPQYTALLQLLGDIAADVETEYLFESSRTSVPDFILNEAVRQPVAMQRFAYQQATIATRMFGLL